MNIYDITETYRNIEYLLDNATEETDMSLLKEALEDIEDKLEEKVENFVYLIRNIEADVQAIKSEEERLYRKRKVLNRKVDTLKETIYNTLIQTGTESIKYPTFKVAIRLNPESVQVNRTDKIPSDYWKQADPTLDKVKLKKALKEGEVIEGVELIRNKSLQIG